MVGSFIGKPALIVCNICNFMSYHSGKLGTIVKTINNLAGHVDSVIGMLPTGLREKVEQYAGRGTTSNNFG
jgi:phosphoribulokinase